MARKTRLLSRHHRKCRSNFGTDDESNISLVLDHHHKAFHLLFLNKDIYGIARILNETWIDPDYKLVVVKKQKEPT